MTCGPPTMLFSQQREQRGGVFFLAGAVDRVDALAALDR